MSESINIGVTAAELLKAVSGGPAWVRGPAERPAGTAPDDASDGAPNPFAALLSGVLQGSQPAPSAGLPVTADRSAEDGLTTTDTDPAAPVLTAVPGTAPTLPAASDDPGPASPRLANGKLPPASGNELPLAGTRVAADNTTHAASGREAAPEHTTGRPRISLADLASGHRLEPATVPTAETGSAGSVEDAAAEGSIARILAGRTASPERVARSGRMVESPAGSTPLAAPLTDETAGRLLPDQVFDGTIPELPSRNLPPSGTGAAFMAGQLAAFATVAGDPATPPTGTPAPGAALTADTAGATLAGRLAGTGLPSLQPLGDTQAFASGLADRLMTIGGPGTHSARLRLNPEHLGELAVEITMDDGSAQVWFGTSTSHAREAIEASLPRLRELFAQQGIELTRTQVDSGATQAGTSGFGEHARSADGRGVWSEARSWQQRHHDPDSDAAAPGTNVRTVTNRLLDVWA